VRVRMPRVFTDPEGGSGSAAAADDGERLI